MRVSLVIKTVQEKKAFYNSKNLKIDYIKVEPLAYEELIKEANKDYRLGRVDCTIIKNKLKIYIAGILIVENIKPTNCWLEVVLKK